MIFKRSKYRIIFKWIRRIVRYIVVYDMTISDLAISSSGLYFRQRSLKDRFTRTIIRSSTIHLLHENVTRLE